MEDLVFKGQDDQVLTSSLLVAEKFGKEHSDVIRAIDNLITKGSDIQCDAKLQVHDMFVEYSEDVSQPNGGIKSARRFIMNRDGFTLLAMGFTGKKAMKFKLDYISAFNKMENILKDQQKPMSLAELFFMQANINLDYEKRIASIEKRIDMMERERSENGKFLLSVSVSSEILPEISMRDKIRRLVNKYSSSTNTKQQDVWHKIYDDLYYLYHISVKAYKKEKKETYLDIAERNGFLDKIYAIISNMVRESDLDFSF